MSSMPVKGVLFDFDGVIVDSMRAHLEAWNLAYTELFSHPIDDATLKSLIGRSSAAISKILCSRAHALSYENKIIKKKYEILNKNKDLLILLPGFKEIREQLIHNNIPFGIVSNAPRKFISQTISNLAIDVPFYFGVEDFSRPKPHPDPYLLGARTLGLTFPEYGSIIVFEDSAHGIIAAKAAYTFPIGIATSSHKDDLEAAGAKLIFNDLQEAALSGVLSLNLST